MEGGCHGESCPSPAGLGGEVLRRACVGPGPAVGDCAHLQRAVWGPGVPKSPTCRREWWLWGTPTDTPQTQLRRVPKAKVQGSWQRLTVLGPGATVEATGRGPTLHGGARAGWTVGCGLQKGPGVRSQRGSWGSVQAGQRGHRVQTGCAPSGRGRCGAWMSSKGLTAGGTSRASQGLRHTLRPARPAPGPGDAGGRSPGSAGSSGSPAGLATRALLALLCSPPSEL